ncbi:hypothetical protein AR457_29440 [Streptomyces agglomeratus]|uniref:Nitroreductase domain-containing protein n=1 Tax=Streptomyces agglomeratus TaxID=285458 RepID=A0A1E5PEN0_9ACTN|nr:thiopeptide-type bacteriocin biosynthesis protein [Streptomyces agglomeratus]OEJ27983.1 hypothetical protein AS594_29325 [Streptomyces agglomeratus]OEJ37956.1 hypothetical protein BGK70_07210 [Streptomyces agglomeratus]OEJ47662.1 hypothetical protein AR457_29440 [Streptomyces agglomeratus]OEJ50484.1 hypothetical protein BGK72_06685 [Streptomyces agglomeratus]OEJ57836.1 hypothetical protein BGM19_07500 [Streptomyces agglomeratus]
MTTMFRTGGTEGTGDGKSVWRSLEVPLERDADRAERLLLTVVGPWAAAATAGGAVESWYWERTGPDGARLRVHVLGDDGSVTALREAIASGGPDGAALEEAVAETPCAPDTDRFGGAEGFAVCAEQFAAGGRLAIETIRATPSREKRLRAAAALTLASASATGADWGGAVQWLRGHASSLAGEADVADARGRAEEDHFRNEAEWQHRHDRTRAEISAPGTTVGDWYRRQCETWAALTARHEAGRLDASPRTVFRALTRLMHQQLGLDAHDQAYVAWLVSMDLVSEGRRDPFFADSPAAADRRTHEYGKYFGARLMDQRPDMPGATCEGRQELPPVLARVELARPQAPGPDAPRFEEVLLARRSAYGYYGGPVTLDELSTLLYFSAGVTAEKTMPGADVSYPVRPYPSGGTRYPLRTLLYCHDVAGLARGTYLYDPAGHALDQLSARDICAELMRMAPATDPRVVFPPKAGGNLHVDDCPLWIFTVADLTFQRLHYGLRSYRLVLQESGHLAQNLALVATWLGKSSVGLGGFYDDTVNETLALDGVNSSVVYVHLVGVVQPPPQAGGAASQA